MSPRRLSTEEYTSRSCSSRALLILLVTGSYLLMTLNANDALPELQYEYSVPDEMNWAIAKTQQLRYNQGPYQLKRGLQTIILQQRSLPESDFSFWSANGPAFKRVLAKCINSCVQGRMSFIRCRSLCK